MFVSNPTIKAQCSKLLSLLKLAFRSFKDRHDMVQHRISVTQQLSKLSECGKIAIVYSSLSKTGGVEYQSRVLIIPSTQKEVWPEIEKLSSRALYVRYRLARPSEVSGLQTVPFSRAQHMFGKNHGLLVP